MTKAEQLIATVDFSVYAKNFAAAYWSTFQREIDQNNPQRVTEDQGGLTKFGISQKAYPKLSIAKLTISDAVAIAHRDYWSRCKLDGVSHVAVAGEIFDTAYNLGCAPAIRIAQQVCLHFGESIGSNPVNRGVDGVMGPLTIGALNRLSASYAMQLILALNGEQYGYYSALIQGNPTKYMKSFKGWMRRVHPYFSLADPPATQTPESPQASPRESIATTAAAAPSADPPRAVNKPSAASPSSSRPVAKKAAGAG